MNDIEDRQELSGGVGQSSHLPCRTLRAQRATSLGLYLQSPSFRQRFSEWGILISRPEVLSLYMECTKWPFSFWSFGQRPCFDPGSPVSCQRFKTKQAYIYLRPIEHA